MTDYASLCHQCPKCFALDRVPNDTNVPRVYECPECFENMVLIDLRAVFPRIDESIKVVTKMIEDTANKSNEIASAHPREWRQVRGDVGSGVRLETLAEVRDNLVTRGIQLFEEQG